MEGPAAGGGVDERRRDRTVTVAGGPVHYVDHGGTPDGPTVVLVHGLGGSHLNWELLAPLLTDRARVLAVDLPGFGRTEPLGRSAAVPANVAVLDGFLRAVAGPGVVLVGNSMGGMVALLAAARSPESVARLVLVDPALPAPVPTAVDREVALLFLLNAVPGLGPALLRSNRRRHGVRGTIRATLHRCGVDPDALPAWLLDRSVALVEGRRDVAGMDRALLRAGRSLTGVLARPRRYRAAMDAVRAPVLLVHGDRDRLVPVAAARDAARRHPDWRYVELHDVGHVPQLQVPQLLAELVRSWLPAG